MLFIYPLILTNKQKSSFIFTFLGESSLEEGTE